MNELRKKIYDFKAAAELVRWPAVSGFLMAAVYAGANQLFGLSPGESSSAAAVTGTLSRLAIGALNGDYAFSDGWEVIWAGIQGVSAIVAPVIAATSADDALSIGLVSMVATQVPRPVLGAMLDVLNLQLPSGGGEILPAPTGPVI
ncbi:MAG TPA: hypothetical protein VF981_02645 [Gemmatimonadaceae bacterium]